MPLIIDGEVLREAVLSDHQPRQATAGDGTIHMLYWDAPRVRSCLLADWPAAQAELAQKAQAKQDAAALRQRVVNVAQSAAGVSVDQLTAPQVRSLVALLLWKAGALDNEEKVKPIGEWVR